MHKQSRLELGRTSVTRRLYETGSTTCKYQMMYEIRVECYADTDLFWWVLQDECRQLVAHVNVTDVATGETALEYHSLLGLDCLQYTGSMHCIQPELVI